MQLYTRTQGTGPAVVALHGLFGSNENLGVIARALSDACTIYAMDLRNHGRSPSGDAMDYPTLAADVRDTMDAYALGSAVLLGHSLGGKTAMQLALSYPKRVRQLIVIDIAPIDHGRRHDRELEAMRSLDLCALSSRAEADRALAPSIPEAEIRQFLLKNFVRSRRGGFGWRIPLDTIAMGYSDIAAAPTGAQPYTGATLFIRGGVSDYMPPEADTDIRTWFPNARIETIADAAHWVHVDQEEQILQLIRAFIKPPTTSAADTQP